MKKFVWLVLVLIIIAGFTANVKAQSANSAPASASDALVGRPAKFVDGVFNIYTDKGDRNNHYIPSGWMGDYGDVKLDDNCKTNPHSGKTCIKFVYTGEGKQGANWAGVFWQNPPNNWGDKKGGFDLRGAKKLTFWARGEKGGERIMEFKMGGLSGTYPDTDSSGIGPIDLTIEWQQFSIDLKDLDLSHINGAFCWATNVDSNPEGCTFYLDDIRFE